MIASAQALGEPSRLDVMKSRDLVNKGNVHLARREFEQALETYTEALMLDPKNQVAKENIVLTHNNWGIINFQQKKYKEARAEWEQALKLNPMDGSVRRNLQILKMTLTKMGLSGEGDPPPTPGANAAKPENEPPPGPSGIVILTPGFKQSQGSKRPAETPMSTTSSGMATYSNNGNAEEKFSDAPAPKQPSSTISNTATYPTQAPSAGGNIESRLASIEMKIYGRKQEELPVLKRLEKLEIDTNGQVKTGTIQDRIEALRQNYGL